ncbi:MAG: hypothetical protein ACOX2O_01220 [Bdellovibrionota bacterium]|jgi:hypothetical protein
MKKYISILATLALLCGTTTAFAATDGTIGTASSTGTAGLTLEIPKLIQITGMKDISLAYVAGQEDKTDNKDICIYANLDAGQDETYTVTGTGNWSLDGTGGTDFYLKRTTGTVDTIAYSVSYNDASGTIGAQALTAGTALTGQTGFSNTVNELCSANQNANYSITITKANILAALHGTYTGTLTLVVAPE